jgi:hypothetical protein
MRRRREASEEKQKRSVPFLPNFITTMSLFCGFYSIMFSLRRDFHWAAILILIAGFIDGLDGRVARMTVTTSEFGKQYDSLSDVIAFGVAPALMSTSGSSMPSASWASSPPSCRCLRGAASRPFQHRHRGLHDQLHRLPIPVAAAAWCAPTCSPRAVRMMGSLPSMTPVPFCSGLCASSSW